MKTILYALLRFYTRKIIQKYKPQIIGITGSIGKTSTKEAVFTVLSAKYKIRENIKNYNNEIGVPLTFIGCESAGKNPFKWLGVFWRAQKLLLMRDANYPEYVVVEMGADKPGDIRYLVDMVPLNVAIITSISESHIEKFGNKIENIYKEKTDIIRFLPNTSYAVLNFDDERVAKSVKETDAQVRSYGFAEGADFQALEVLVSGQAFDDNTDVAHIRGVSFKVSHGGSTMPFMLPKVLGSQHINSALAACAVGVIYGMNLIEISEALRKYCPPNGRMNLIEGIKHTLIIDDSYNASPASTRNAIESASMIRLKDSAQTFVVLGDMLELGSHTNLAHAEIGALVASKAFDYLFTVGELGEHIARAARSQGMPEDRVVSFSTSEEAGKFLQDRIEQGDLILVKGSQGVRMEKVVKEIMAEPLRAFELLVRQDESWLRK